MFFLKKKGVGSIISLHSTNNVKNRLRSYTDIDQQRPVQNVITIFYRKVTRD